MMSNNKIKPDTKDMFLIYTRVVGKPINALQSHPMFRKRFSRLL